MNSIESIYYVVSWLCHRQCPHCYDERFRPYQGAELAAVTAEPRANFERIIDHFPDSMRYRIPGDAGATRTGRIILSGGEVLLPQTREPVLYPAIERIIAKYRPAGGVNVVVQTTGDLVTEKIVEELLACGVWMISVSGMDDFHEGFTRARRAQLMEQLVAMFERAGMHPHRPATEGQRVPEDPGPVFSFIGATEEAWIGKIWPRGRAWRNGLSRATLADNFCNAWSGGLNFLNLGLAGSEVSIEPNGNVYPCCMKTRRPIGNLVEEPLIEILRSLVGHPVFEAISMGHPERMGLRHGWSVDRFHEASRTTPPGGQPYENLCIGCDRFQAEVLGPVLEELRVQRLARRQSATVAS